MNTRIEYLYRDADNYKVGNEVVIEGTLTEAEIEEIIGICDDGGQGTFYFIPRQVGLPEKRFDKIDPDSDHCWFELWKDEWKSSFSETEDAPTEPITAKELLEAFRKVGADSWDDSSDDWMDGYDFYDCYYDEDEEDEDDDEDFDDDDDEEECDD